MKSQERETILFRWSIKYHHFLYSSVPAASAFFFFLRLSPFVMSLVLVRCSTSHCMECNFLSIKTILQKQALNFSLKMNCIWRRRWTWSKINIKNYTLYHKALRYIIGSKCTYVEHETFYRSSWGYPLLGRQFWEGFFLYQFIYIGLMGVNIDGWEMIFNLIYVITLIM